MKNHDLFCKAFQELLLQMRQENFISQTRLSRDSGISRQSIHLMEVGKRIPSFEKFCHLASGMGVSPVDLSKKFISIYQTNLEESCLKVAENDQTKKYRARRKKQ